MWVVFVKKRMTHEVKERKPSPAVRDETAGMPGGAVTGDG